MPRKPLVAGAGEVMAAVACNSYITPVATVTGVGCNTPGVLRTPPRMLRTATPRAADGRSRIDEGVGGSDPSGHGGAEDRVRCHLPTRSGSNVTRLTVEYSGRERRLARSAEASRARPPCKGGCGRPRPFGRSYCSWDCLPVRTKRGMTRPGAAPHRRPATCPICSADFITKRTNQIYCSALCNNRATKRRLYSAGSKRHFPRIRYRQRAAIFERDDWRCGLCGGLIDKALRWPHPGSPSIDHVDPNGEHVPENWQAAHLACNVQAGAKRAAA
jgi:hypothetical protein